MKFEYALVARVLNSDPVQWQWKGPDDIATGALLAILNQAGRAGWEAVAAGDFGGSPTAEILMKRVLPPS